MPKCHACRKVISDRRFKHHVCIIVPDAADDAEHDRVARRDRSASAPRDRSASPPAVVHPAAVPPVVAGAPAVPLPAAALPPPVNGEKLELPSSLSRDTFAFIVLLRIWAAVFNISTRALTTLLRILSFFVPSFPSLSLWQINRRCHLNDDRFQRLVVCTKCSLLYDLDDCIDRSIDPVTNRPRNCAIPCRGVQYPFHPLAAKRTACGNPLVEKRNGKFVPLQQFHHTSLKVRLAELLQR